MLGCVPGRAGGGGIRNCCCWKVLSRNSSADMIEPSVRAVDSSGSEPSSLKVPASLSSRPVGSCSTLSDGDGLFSACASCNRKQ